MQNLLDKITIKHVLVVGLILRLLAAFFAKGYAFQDDHFGVVELAQQWRDSISFNWLGGSVYIFSLIYAGIHYALFEFCEALGIHHPRDIMLVVRLFHALISMLTVYYSYLLARRLAGREDMAIMIAGVMAVFWIFPFMSVRNLQEFFCIPFLLMGSYYSADPHLRTKSLVLAGFFFALAVCIRMQTIFIPFGTGIYLLLKKPYFRKAILFGLFFCVSLMLTQGLFDFILYGDPIASIAAYISYNSNPANIEGYPQGPWYQYIGTMAGITLGLSFIPIAFGYVYSARMSSMVTMLFVSSLFFFLFHSYYSNKQERFILPFVPYFLLLGIIGFRNYFEKHSHQSWLVKATKFFIAWFVIMNFIGLVILSFTYSKRSRVEAMNYLRNKGDVTNIIMEGFDSPPQAPLFYLGKHLQYYRFSRDSAINNLQDEIKKSAKPAPNYVIMTGNQDMDQRLERLKTIFPNLKQETIVTTSFVDNLAYWLNPKHNQNENWYIYRIE